MNLLLGTHAFVWFLNGDQQLSPKAKEWITDSENLCFISIASLWEIAIKSSLKKLELSGSFNELLPFMAENEMHVLPLSFDHIQQLLQLEYHHRDPFDRIIAAQALTEKLTLISRDTIFGTYGVETKWS